jgi:outer membrane protein assembly factor BamD
MSGRTLLLLLGAALLLLGGCTTVEKRLSAKEYYNQANEAYDREDFSKAVDVYHDLLDQYPLNPYAEEAQLKIAYSYYMEKKYAEAIAGFSDFERAYPTSIHLPFVEYYRGMCYLEQMRSIDRDQSVTEKAYDHFRAVTDRFPGSSFSSLAEKKVRICRDAMAAHELLIADFYDKYDNTGAAKARLRMIIENYPETDGTVAALERLHNILAEEGKNDLADLAEQARAVRMSGATSSEKSAQESATLEVASALPPPGVDPLLLLVTELKKQENEQRQNAQTAIRAETKKMTEKANKVPTDQEEKEE